MSPRKLSSIAKGKTSSKPMQHLFSQQQKHTHPPQQCEFQNRIRSEVSDVFAWYWCGIERHSTFPIFKIKFIARENSKRIESERRARDIIVSKRALSSHDIHSKKKNKKTKNKEAETRRNEHTEIHTYIYCFGRMWYYPLESVSYYMRFHVHIAHIYISIVVYSL